MPEKPKGATDLTAALNLARIMKEQGRPGGYSQEDELASIRLRKELQAKGLKGFKKGGKVKKTGLAKVHRGEKVLTVKQAKAHATAKAQKRRSAARKAPTRRR